MLYPHTTRLTPTPPPPLTNHLTKSSLETDDNIAVVAVENQGILKHRFSKTSSTQGVLMPTSPLFAVVFLLEGLTKKAIIDGLVGHDEFKATNPFVLDQLRTKVYPTTEIGGRKWTNDEMSPSRGRKKTETGCGLKPE